MCDDKVTITFTIDKELKEQCEKICAEAGLTLEEATILFFEETLRQGKIPFEVDDELMQEALRMTKEM